MSGFELETYSRISLFVYPRIIFQLTGIRVHHFFYNRLVKIFPLIYGGNTIVVALKARPVDAIVIASKFKTAIFANSIFLEQ